MMAKSIEHRQKTASRPQLQPPASFRYTSSRAVVVMVEGATVGFHLTETSAMFFFAPILVLGAIAFFCWLLFTLAVYALPFVAGVYAGIGAFHTGAGALGAIVVGLVAAGAIFGLGQLLLIFVPWAWAKLLIIAVYTAPAVVAGYCATHSITLMAMSSPVWQTIFSVIGAIAVGITALLRISGMVTFAEQR
jgi:hypothetical protein